MAKERSHIDITQNPEALRIVEMAESASQPVVLTRGSTDVAILRVVKRPARRGARKGRPTGPADPLWNIIGMGASAGPGDVSENVDKHLADAYLPKER